MATFQRIRLHGQTPPLVAGGKDPWRHRLYLAEAQRSDEENREINTHPKVFPSPYLDFLTHAPTAITIIARILAQVTVAIHQSGRTSACDTALM